VVIGVKPHAEGNTIAQWVWAIRNAYGQKNERAAGDGRNVLVPTGFTGLITMTRVEDSYPWRLPRLVGANEGSIDSGWVKRSASRSIVATGGKRLSGVRHDPLAGDRATGAPRRASDSKIEGT